jgi:hypothetical protein
LSLKFTKIDPLSFPDHANLRPDDICYHLGEYTANRGYSFSTTNQLIINLKKKPTGINEWERRHKETAIMTVAAAFRQTLYTEVNRAKLKAATLVPIPPSAIEGDPLYDNRMTLVLKAMGSGLDLDIRELVKQYRSVPPAHQCAIRPTITDIVENYYIDEDLTEPTPTSVWIFDDVLTAGNHYKAMQAVIQERFPGIGTAGFFAARRVPEADDPENLSLFSN